MRLGIVWRYWDPQKARQLQFYDLQRRDFLPHRPVNFLLSQFYFFEQPHWWLKLNVIISNLTTFHAMGAINIVPAIGISSISGPTLYRWATLARHNACTTSFTISATVELKLLNNRCIFGTWHLARLFMICNTLYISEGVPCYSFCAVQTFTHGNGPLWQRIFRCEARDMYEKKTCEALGW